MRLQKAIEVVSGLKELTDGQTAVALGCAILALKEKSEEIQEEAASAETVLLRALPGTDAERLAAWKHLRPIMRLSVDTAIEVDRRLRHVAGK